MNIIRLSCTIMCLLMLSWTSAYAADGVDTALPPCKASLDAKAPAMQFFFPDGQLTNRLLSVFVSHSVISSDPKPELLLKKYNAVDSVVDEQVFEAKLVDHHQLWAYQQTQADGSSMQVSAPGTLMMFDISGFKLPLIRPFIHVTPVIRWQDTERGCYELISIPDGQVNLANNTGIALNTLLLISVLALLLTAIAAQAGGSWASIIQVLCEKNGKLSLSKVQMALWTGVILAVVYAYSLARTATPEIPETLLLLMGASYATRALVQWQGGSSTKDESIQAIDQPRVTPQLIHLVSDSDGCLSLPRMQMLVWTILTIIMFITKSLLDGHMWDVPLELVALMGMSQLGYAVPSMTHGKKAN
ncbi:MAG: hypothetical protein Q9M09_05050 [Mariprofundaceae bacterium]|nr:hypothetical protein [Mariprofundaceae bacterium]